jgi:hypothetical protein
MIKTFQKEIEWVGYDLNQDQTDTEEITRVKTATFKELCRTDKTQHKLHFKIISMFEGMHDDQKEALRNAKNPDEKQEVLEDSEIGLNTDVLYDITVKAIKHLLIIDQDFNEIDRKELLQDSLALLSLGLWLFANHFAPFFQKLKMK